MPPHRDREDSIIGTIDDTEDDHILDKGFTETPSSTPSRGEYGDADSLTDTSDHEGRLYGDFISSSERVHGRPLLSENDTNPAWHSRPPEIQDKVQTYVPAEGQGGSSAKKNSTDSTKVPPPEYSILIVSLYPWSLHSISHHIRMTLPKTSPHHIELASSYTKCLERLNAERDTPLTHIVINLPEQSEVVALLREIRSSDKHASTSLLVLTNPIQRAALIEGVVKEYEEVGESHRIQVINKPIKPSRFGSIFDPEKERDASMDRNRNSAQQVVETQKRVFTEMEKDVGNKGHRVLLVEDNQVNRKVRCIFIFLELVSC